MINRSTTYTAPVAAVIVLLLTAASNALADGFMVTAREAGISPKIVESPRQEALIVVGDSAVDVVLRTHFNAGPSELAWLVPVPTRPINVRPADKDLFAELDVVTRPTFYEMVYSRPLFKLGCSASGGPEPVHTTVTVAERGEAGIFEYVVLSATDSNDLATWLDENGYALPDGLAETVEPYVKATWSWLAFRVRPEETDAATLAPHPIAYTYFGPTIYPLAISALSAAEENEILLYVVADKAYRCGNWSTLLSRDMLEQASSLYGPGHQRVTGTSSTPSGTTYEHRLRFATAEHQEHLFVVEYADILSGDLKERVTQEIPVAGERVLTRLRALVVPEAYDRDVDLIPSSMRPPYRTSIEVRGESPHAAAMPWAILVAAAGLFTTGRRWRGRRRALAVTCTVAACLLLTML